MVQWLKHRDGGLGKKSKFVFAKMEIYPAFELGLSDTSTLYVVRRSGEERSY